MGTSWTSKKLGNVINLKRGYDLPSSKRIAGNIPVMTSSGKNGTHNEYKVDGPGVITGRSGQLGKVFYTEDNYWPLNTTLYVEDFKGYYPKFIYFLLQTLNFEQFNAGSSVPTLNRNHVHQLEVLVPSFALQKRIGDILYLLEEKMKLNLESVETIEKLCETIFKNWFIDFEFPNEEGLPYRSSGGEMVESEIGEIPYGWSILELKALTTLYKKTFNPKKTDIEEVKHFSLPAFDSKNYPTLDKVLEIKSNKWIVEKNCVLFSKMNPITPRIWVPKVNEIYLNVASSEFVVLKNESFEETAFIYTICKSQPFIEYLKANATGSTNSRQRITPDNAILYKLAIDLEVGKEFSVVVAPLVEQIQELYEEINKLELLRDTLLPKLLSGEIEIPDESVVD